MKFGESGSSLISISLKMSEIYRYGDMVHKIVKCGRISAHYSSIFGGYNAVLCNNFNLNTKLQIF